MLPKQRPHVAIFGFVGRVVVRRARCEGHSAAPMPSNVGVQFSTPHEPAAALLVRWEGSRARKLDVPAAAERRGALINPVIGRASGQLLGHKGREEPGDEPGKVWGPARVCVRFMRRRVARAGPRG